MQRPYLLIAGFVIALTASMSAQPDSPPPLPNYQYLSSWTFNETNWLTTLGYSPRACSNVVAATSFVNAPPGCNCVSIDSSEPAFLQYDVVQEDGHRNITLDAGTLMWWFQPNWTSATNGGGPGAWAPLIEVGRWSSNFQYGCFAVSIDPGGTNLYVEGQTNGAGAVYLQAPINWNEGEWHQIAVTYDTNSALYIDGALITNGPAIAYRPSASECAQDGLFIGSEATGTLQARGQFESMRTLNYAMPADCIQGNYSYTVARYFPLQSGSTATPPSTDSNNGIGLNSPRPMDASGSSGGLTLGIAFGMNANSLILTLNGTQPGNLYQILTNLNVGSTGWQGGNPIAASNTSIVLPITNSSSTMFYRVLGITNQPQSQSGERGRLRCFLSDRRRSRFVHISMAKKWRQPGGRPWHFGRDREHLVGRKRSAIGVG